MAFVRLFSVLLSVLLTSVMSCVGKQGTTWILIPSQNDRLSDVNPTFQVTRLFAEECALFCSQTEECRSFYFTETTKRCSLYTCVMNGANSTASPSTKYYRFSEYKSCSEFETKGYVYSAEHKSYIKFYLSPEQNWLNSSSSCIADGGHLVTITNKGLDDWLHSIIKSRPDYSYVNFFIDGNDELDKNSWIDWSGKPLLWTNWGSKQPSNSGGGVTENCNGLWNEVDHRWNDFRCAERHAYICQIDIV